VEVRGSTRKWPGKCICGSFLFETVLLELRGPGTHSNSLVVIRLETVLNRITDKSP